MSTAVRNTVYVEETADGIDPDHRRETLAARLEGRTVGEKVFVTQHVDATTRARIDREAECEIRRIDRGDSYLTFLVESASGYNAWVYDVTPVVMDEQVSNPHFIPETADTVPEAERIRTASERRAKVSVGDTVWVKQWATPAYDHVDYPTDKPWTVSANGFRDDSPLTFLLHDGGTTSRWAYDVEPYTTQQEQPAETGADVEERIRAAREQGRRQGQSDVQAEFDEFKDKVGKIADEYADRHGWCEVIDEALSELGIERPSRDVEVRVEFILRIPDANRDVRERVNDNDTSWIANALGLDYVDFSGDGDVPEIETVDFDITNMEVVED